MTNSSIGSIKSHVFERKSVVIAALSDTHGYHEQVCIPKVDIIIHAGDALRNGSLEDLRDFLQWFEHQSALAKILIAGNHCACFETDPDLARSLVKEVAPSVVYLQDEMATIEGLTFWGSPYTPTFFNWYNMRNRGADIKRHWNLIPEGIDVLVTHGPPAKVLDGKPQRDYLTGERIPIGCADLFEAVERVKPKLHVYGHVHHGYGTKMIEWPKGHTQFINAAICDERYYPVNKPWQISLSPSGNQSINPS